MPERIISFPVNTVFTSTDLDVPALMETYREGGKEYICLQGVVSTVVGSVVTFDEVGVSTLLAANAIGLVAVAQGAVDATSKRGWYLVNGSCQAKVSAGFADNANCYATATAGEIDDAIVAGDRVKNMIGRSGIASGTALVQVSHPFMDDALAA